MQTINQMKNQQNPQSFSGKIHYRKYFSDNKKSEMHYEK